MTAVTAGIALKKALRLALERDEIVRPHVEAVQHAPDWRARLDAIRALYAVLRDDEVACQTYCGYDLGLYDLFTPIERALWDSLRIYGLPAVPQYPVGAYTLDFALPKQRIGIEADGREFHDHARDEARDESLWRKHGWRVFRLTGGECIRVVPSPGELREELRDHIGCEPDEHDMAPGLRAFYWTTACGLVLSIKHMLVENSRHEHSGWMLESLERHRLASFRIGADW
jgi:hypothetical protein